MRNVPPPILDVTGKLKEAVRNSEIKVLPYMLVLSADVTDNRGNHYANYHNEGTDRMDARPFYKHSKELQQLQLIALKRMTGKLWQAR